MCRAKPRRYRSNTSDRDAVGSFRQTEHVRAAWQLTLAGARALNARKKNQEPALVFDPSKLKAEADWIKACLKAGAWSPPHYRAYGSAACDSATAYWGACRLTEDIAPKRNAVHPTN